MWSLTTKTNEILILKHKDFQDINNKNMFFIMQTRGIREKSNNKNWFIQPSFGL